MLYMLVRNVVRDAAVWRDVFDEQAPAARDAGLHVEHVWSAADEANTMYVVFRVKDRARADAYVAAPESAEAGERAGVIDGDLTYVEDIDDGA
jgi:hypothetical protein